MLASRFAATSIPDIMADDTMEISSDHGHNADGEDIDIDIDFTAGHIDEDYVLEDATSNVGFGDSFQVQSSPALGHDDLMLDDGDESYSMHVDGADIMRDDEHSMKDEPLEMASVSVDGPAVLVHDSHSGSTSHLQDGVMNDEVSWETNDEPAPEPGDNEATLENSDTKSASNEVDSNGQMEENATTREAEEPYASPSNKNSQANSPLLKSTNVPAVNEERGSSLAFIAATETESQERGSSIPADPASKSAASPDVVTAYATDDTDEKAKSPSAPEVTIIYQDSEYSLFSQSETDDIESFFISDISVVDKPLSVLFEDLRSVIHNDLSDEDELYISAKDLGLDIDETCLATQSVTIGQMISLHERLLQNDGINPARPLCVVLGTKPNFLVRFATLISGASEGKGLSELVRWDEKSEHLNDSTHISDNEYEEAPDKESHEDEERVKEGNKNDQEEYSHQQDSKDASNQEDSQEKGDIESFNDSANKASSGILESSNSSPVQTDIEAYLPVPKNEVAAGGEDEEGDLIDYSDMEDPAQAERGKVVKSRLAKLENDESTTENADLEATNGELRQRSSARTVKDNSSDSAAPSVHDENLDINRESNSKLETEIDYNEIDDEDFEGLDPDAPSADYRKDQETELNQEDEVYTGNGDANDGETADDNKLNTGLRAEDDQQPFKDFDFDEEEEDEDEDDSQNPQLPAAKGHETRLNDGAAASPVEFNGQLSKENNSVASSLGFADAPDSESATSEKTLEAQAITIEDSMAHLNEENEDEIDYDDDEEPSVSEGQNPIQKEPQDLNTGSAKRQRTDDDDPNGESKEAKRSRS